jgi:putative copper resistance protein D
VSGLPLDRVLDRQTLGTVLNETSFGRVWMVRLGLALILGALLISGRPAANDRGSPSRNVASGLLAGGLLASLAWAGHAAAEQGADRIIHLLADTGHLLAAGLWLGALPPLVFVLARARHATASAGFPIAARMTRRFSMLGIVGVGCLVLTGVVNGWYLVGSVPRLFGTPYGHLLLLKLALFMPMLALVVFNRVRLMPKLSKAPETAPDGVVLGAIRGISRNAALESVLGFTIVLIVGALGTATPGTHVQPVWPFPFTFGWERLEASGGIRILAIVAGIGSLAAAGAAGLGVRTNRRGMARLGWMGGGITIAVLALCVIVPAYPTTYFESPTRYTAPSIARGASLYAEHCANCHGPYRYGDGPVAASLAVKPPNLAGEPFFRRREGDLFEWLTNGIAGTPMPGFGDRLSEPERWDLINYLIAEADAEAGEAMNDKVLPWRPIAAPDFTFQIDRDLQESLTEQRGRFAVLLVLATLPDSLARLAALSESKGRLERAGVRIIVVPMHEAARQGMDRSGVDASIVAVADPRLVSAYTLFRRTASAERVLPVPSHMEFLIDRQGYLRARWIPAAKPGWDRMPYLLWEATVLNGEKVHPSIPKRHGH